MRGKFLLVIIIILVLLFAYNGFNGKTFSESDFEKVLENNNINFEKIEIKNSKNGIEKMLNYYFDDESVLNLYVFDKDSELYKKVKKNEYISDSEMDNKIFLTINQNLGISFENNSIYKGIIIDGFEKMK